MPFRAQPFDVGPYYARIGQSVEDVSKLPMQALEIIDDLKTKQLDRKIKEFDLQTAMDELEQKKLSRKFKEAAIMDFIDTYEGRYDEPGVSATAEGPPAPETAKLSQKMSKKQFLGTVKELAGSIDDDEKFKRILGNIGTLIQRDMPQSRDYGGAIQFNQWNPGQLQYEDFMDKIADMNNNQKKTFFDQKLPKAMKQYESTLPTKGKPMEKLGTREGFESFLLNHPEWSDIATNELIRDKEFAAALDKYPSTKDVEMTRIKELEARQARAERKGKIDRTVALQNQNAFNKIQQNISNAHAQIEKLTGRKYSALKGDTQFIAPEKLSDLQADDQKKALKIDENINKWETQKNLINLAIERDDPDIMTTARADAIYKDIIDGSFDTRDGKTYGPLLGFSESKTRKEEIPETPTIKTGGLPEPKTQAEYDALPSGTRYKHPDGSIKTKR